jgi:hypothetical protein
MATSYTRRMTYTPTGEAFSDYLVESVGVLPFQTLHDLFIAEDLEIRNAPGGGGTLLVEDTDFTLSGKDDLISDLITAAIGSGRRAMRYITIINAAYQACDLYVSGKHVCDQFDKEDGGEMVALVDEDYTVPDNTHDVSIDLTTVATEREITVGALARNLGRTITLQMNNASIEGYEGKLSCPAGEHFLYKGAEYDNLYVHFGGDRVSVEVREDGYYITGGVVNPVALEPDIGGGWHSHHFQIWTNLNPADTNWHEDDSLAAELPDGVKLVRKDGYAIIDSGVDNMTISFSEATGGTVRDINIGRINAAAWSHLPLAGFIRLSVTKSFWYKASSADIGNCNMWAEEYLLGPA